MSRVKPFPVMILRNKRITRSSSKRNNLLLALNIKGKNIEVQPKDKLYYPLPKVYKGKKNKKINQYIEFKRTNYDKEHEAIEYTLNSTAKEKKDKVNEVNDFINHVGRTKKKKSNFDDSHDINE
ncbi:hypothetical protein Glove_106g2 [Diversispora epigaea]|uniref:Uncharacterized protein n=1 Tax=Diversispora epigaea TaxID=1348612 RepID=A0A397JBZ0_9GLOM|nr:hypothetical protein Glove_106g2 [Diversispora epigaea]